MPTVTGTIRLPAPAPHLSGVPVIVRVRDVTSADAPDAPSWDQRLVVDVAPQGAVPFLVEVDDGAVDPARSYNLEVHVDLDGSGYFSRGDLISMSVCPVLTQGAPDDVDVPVDVVG